MYLQWFQYYNVCSALVSVWLHGIEILSIAKHCYSRSQSPSCRVETGNEAYILRDDFIL